MTWIKHSHTHTHTHITPKIKIFQYQYFKSTQLPLGDLYLGNVLSGIFSTYASFKAEEKV